MAVDDASSDQTEAPGAEAASSREVHALAAEADTDTVNGSASDSASAPSAGRGRSGTAETADRLPIKMLNDRIMVRVEGADGERKSSGGILIPATAQVGKRLAWAQVVATGPSVRTMELGDRVLFNPEDRYEVEVGGRDYIILRERDIHAVAAERLDATHTGLYL